MSPAPALHTVHATVAAVWRQESARLVATVARYVRDIGVAEELAQDAVVAALDHWPAQGVPANPAAWLMTTAKNRALDHLRHRQMAQVKHDDLAGDLQAQGAHMVPDFSETLDAARETAALGDDLLRLMFTACHPILATQARVALTLKLLGGLTTAEIARAFLVPEATVAQRLVRAKRTLAEAGVPFEAPRGEELVGRLGSVLEVIYLIFNEGYTATSGADWMRPALCDEALRLGRLLADIAPGQSEVHGLEALMAIQASRVAARTDSEGNVVLLADQDRGRWDAARIEQGLGALARAQALGQPAGSYQLQAEIAACHARATHVDQTDWVRIADLYGQLMRVAPSPVVELNRAVAVGMAEGPAAGLAILDKLRDDKALQNYPWLPAVQGDLLEKLGRQAQARDAFLRAADLTRNEPEKRWLLQRAQAAQA
ncbi:MAG: RNA polymerase sigma factor [Burkholderiaceae bacterium]